MLIPQKNNEDYVKKYRSENLNVIPCRVPEEKGDREDAKKPAILWKEFEYKKFDGDIKPDANIAIICGKVSENLVVVDIDKSDLDLVNQIYPDALNETRVIKTGSGGYHLYFRVPELPKKPLRLNKANGDHVDVQVNGTYVIAPPSIHPNGREYKIISEVDKIKTINFQDVVVNLEKAGFKVDKKISSVDLVKGGIKKGNRHNMALKYCAKLFLRHGFDVELVKREMYDWNKTNEPPIPQEELDKIITDSTKYSQEKLQKVIDSSTKLPKKEHTKIAYDIIDKHYFKTLKETEEVLVYEHGVYRPYGKIKIKQECELVIEDCHNSLVAEVIGTVQRKTYRSRDEFDGDLYLLNLQNGILDIRNSQLTEHNPKHLFRVQLPIEYNTNAVPVKFMKFLREIAPPDYVLWILDMIAYCLVRNCKQEKGMILIGGGGNGKSTLLNFISMFLGKDNVVNHSTQELQYNRFAKADLDGKLANIHPDVESNEIKKAGILKMLISGDRIQVEQKNRDPYSMQSYAKLIFSANQLPDVSEQTMAFFQRWIVLDFVKIFRGTDEENKELLEELTTDEELSGVLNVVMKRMPKLLSKEGAFKNAPSGSELKRTWKDHANSVESFSNNEIKIEEGVRIRKKNIFQIYLIYCEKNNFRALSERTFSQRFKENLASVVKDSVYKENGLSVRYWVNINLKNPPENMPKDPSQKTIDFS